MFDPLLPSAVTFGATLGYSLKLVWSVWLHRESTALVCLMWYWKNKPVQPAKKGERGAESYQSTQEAA